MTATELDLDEIRARVAERTQAEKAEVSAAVAQRYRHVRPLSDAAESFIDYTTNVDGRYYLGLPEIDMMTRGGGRGELMMLSGRSHTGKSQVALNAICNNPQSHTLYFSMDEPVELVLSKLVSIKHGVDAEQLEDRIKKHDPDAVALIRRAASVDFRNLIVVDTTLPATEQAAAVNEAEDYWQEGVDVLIWDYLELQPSAAGDQQAVVAAAQGIKRFTKDCEAFGIAIHQSKTSSTPRGKPGGIEGMRFGGTAEAIFVLETWRKLEDEDLTPHERMRAANTISLGLWKNKRPPGKKGAHDYYMDPRTGLIRPLQDGDMFAPGDPIRDPSKAYATATGGMT